MAATKRKSLIFCAILGLGLIEAAPSAEARGAHHHAAMHRHGGIVLHHRNRRYARGGSVIQCVAFAKQDTGIEIAGNARDWWGRAAGVYQRGQQPEVGSVLSFAPNGRMRLGHVAVVSGIADSRTILIDQSHWGSRGISRATAVVDVSEANDWTAVRVQLRRGGAYGSIYTTHGFIYPRADQREPGVVEASAAPSNAGLRHSISEEVAEAPSTARGIDLSLQGIATDAPDRSLR